MDYEAVIFDLDGTLVNTISDIANSMNRVLIKMGLPAHEIAEYYYFVGAGLKELCRRVLPKDLQYETKVLEYRELFNEDYNQNWHNETYPYPGIIELLEYLQQKNKTIAILSNKPDHFCKLFVQHFFPNINFAIVRGNLDSLPPKPHPAGGMYITESLNLDPKDVLFVGDSDIDMQTAANCGFIAMGAEWGFRSQEELLKAGAKHIFSSPSHLLKFLQEI
jgi:phosphoglycolate phosphatase